MDGTKGWTIQKYRIRRKIELKSLCNVFIWVNLGGIIAQFQSPSLYASLAFPLPERKLIKWLANSHKKRLESDWHHCRWDTHTHTHTQHYKNCEHVCVCLCVHTVKHFQHLINQLLTWQVDWHVLHLLLLSVSCLTHAHTHICEHTLDIERQWEPLICISWTWHTHIHTHSLLLSCPILVPKSSVIMTQYKNNDQLCHNVPRSRNHLCTIKTRGGGPQNGKKVFFVFSHEKRRPNSYFFQMISRRNQQHLCLPIRLWTVFHLKMAEVIIY